MKRKLIQLCCFGAVAVAVVLLSGQRAEAGLFDFLERLGNTDVELTHYLPETKDPCAPAPRCCPKPPKCCKPAPPKCCAPKPKCCPPKPKCCKPAPKCCKPAPKCCAPSGKAMEQKAAPEKAAPKKDAKPEYEEKSKTEKKA